MRCRCAEIAQCDRELGIVNASINELASISDEAGGALSKRRRDIAESSSRSFKPNNAAALDTSIHKCGKDIVPAIGNAIESCEKMQATLSSKRATMEAEDKLYHLLHALLGPAYQALRAAEAALASATEENVERLTRQRNNARAEVNRIEAELRREP